MNSTRDPIAYFHEGLHVAANQAYQDLMGVNANNEGTPGYCAPVW